MLFQNISFELASGKVLHLTGPNGAGKTSLLRMMAGVLLPAAGTLSKPGTFIFLGADNNILKPAETVSETLAFWGKIYGATKNRSAQVMNIMDISPLADVPVRRLSMGQKRRLNLARILLPKTSLWLLDEPCNALDSAAVKLFASALNEHLAGGGKAVIASHTPLDFVKKNNVQLLELG